MSADPDVPRPETTIENNDPLDLPIGCTMVPADPVATGTTGSIFLPDGTQFAVGLAGGVELVEKYFDVTVPPDVPIAPPLTPPEPDPELTPPAVAPAAEGDPVTLPIGCWVSLENGVLLPDGTQFGQIMDDAGRAAVNAYVAANPPGP